MPHQALLLLVKQALQNSEEGSVVAVTARLADDGATTSALAKAYGCASVEYLRFEVADDGPAEQAHGAAAELPRALPCPCLPGMSCRSLVGSSGAELTRALATPWVPRAGHPGTPSAASPPRPGP